MHKFETTLAYNREKIIDTCRLELSSDGYHEVFSLNKEEVKQLLDLMQEAHSLMGKNINEVPSSFIVETEWSTPIPVTKTSSYSEVSNLQVI